MAVIALQEKELSAGLQGRLGGFSYLHRSIAFQYQRQRRLLCLPNLVDESDILLVQVRTDANAKWYQSRQSQKRRNKAKEILRCC